MTTATHDTRSAGVGAGLSTLCPCRVEQTDGGRALVTVPLGSGPARLWAEPAMALEYLPDVGDVLLIAANVPGDADADAAPTAWIIGVVRGTGSVALVGVGDVRVESLAGSLRLGAADEIEASATTFTVFADTVRTIAERALDTLGELIQTVRGTRLVRSGLDVHRVDGPSIKQAERIVEHAQKQVAIDGETIHLG